MNYYYNKDGKNYGPVTIEELQALAEQGEIQRQTPVIQKGQKEWMRWGSLEDSLVSEAAPVAKPAPAPRRAPKTEPLQLSDKLAFVGKITAVYDKIDGACERLCRGGLAAAPEQYKKKMSLLNGFVGIGTLLCVLCLCIGLGLYQSPLVFLVVMIVGAVLQYISYQMYCAMSPLLFGEKIKLSSMWLPRILAFACVPLILACLGMMFVNSSVSTFMTMIGGMITLLAVAYCSLGCSNTFVEINQEGIVPGRELINLVRFLVRVFFTTVHVLTPVYMLLASLVLLLHDKKELFAADPMSLLFSMFGTFAGGVAYALPIAVLPIITLPLFYLNSFLPDFAESFFTRGDNKS